MRVTFESTSVGLQYITIKLAELDQNELRYEILRHGKKSNIASDTTSYVIFTIQLLGDISIGLVSAFIYDLLKDRTNSVKINGKKLEDCSINEIKLFIQEIEKNDDSNTAG